MIEHVLRLDGVFEEENGFIIEGWLTCSNPRCGFRFPVLDGVPILLRYLEDWLASGASMASCPGDTGEMKAYLRELKDSGKGAPTAKSLLGTYLDRHYGDMSDPPEPLKPCHGALSGFWAKLVTLAYPHGREKDGLALELGCSVGRFTFEMASFSDLAVGLDVDFDKVVSAARAQRSGRVTYERKKRGASCETVEATFSPARNTLFVVGDALEPPFRAEMFDFVAGINILDNVALPLTLMGQMDALLKRGGTLVTGSPYAWRPHISEPSQWLESEELDAAETIRCLLEGKLLPETGLAYGVEEELHEVPWLLRHDERHWTLFLLHLLRARKN